MSKNFLFILFVSPFFRMLIMGQSVDVQAYLKAYPHEQLVYLNKDERCEVQVKENKLRIIQHHHEEFLLLKTNLSSIRSKKIRTGTFLQVNKLEANILVYNGKKHKKNRITNVELKSENESGETFYDDDQYYDIRFLEAKEGDIITIDYDCEYLEPRFFGIFFFSDYYPTMKNAVTLISPADIVSLKTRLINNQNIKINSADTKQKNTRILTWSADSVEAITEEYLDASFRHKSSYIMINVESYKTKDSVVNLGGSLDNLYKWYTGLLKNVDLVKDKRLVTLTDSLVKDQSNDLDKLKVLFSWVQEKISYLAYEDGMNGYVPREAAVVYKQKFGDCKDMSNLTVKMCQIAHLPVYPAWIGTRDIPYQFSEFPAPFCANHMIAVYISGADTIFLDATGKNHPFKLPTSMIQGKEALVGISEDKYIVTRVPYTSQHLSREVDSISIRILPDNKIAGEGYYTLTGYEKIRLSGFLEKQSYESQKKSLRNLLQKGNNKFTLDTFYVVQHLADKPLIVFYKFNVPDYVATTAGYSMININFLKDYFDPLILSKRKYMIDFSYKSVHKLVVKLELGPADKVDYLPENVSASNNLLSFNLKYTSAKNSVQFDNTISFNESSIAANEFASFDMILGKYKKNKSQIISISQK